MKIGVNVKMVLRALPLAVLVALTVSGKPSLAADLSISSRYPGYRIIDLNNNSYQEMFYLDDNENAVFIGPKQPRRKHLWVIGGKHVAIIGGKFAPAYSGNDRPTATLQLKQQSGSIWIEDVSIDNQDAFGMDGITLNAAGTKAIPATIKDTRVENIQGREDAHMNAHDRAHGDMVQPMGRISELNIINFFGSTTYQGLFLMRQDNLTYGGKVDRINLRDVELRHLPGGERRCLYLISVGGDQDITFSDVKLTRQPNKDYCGGESVLVKGGASIRGAVDYLDIALPAAIGSGILR